MNELLERFSRNVAAAPDMPFLYDDTVPGGMTFARFDDMSGRVYGWLKTRGIGREDFVMIRVPRGIMPFVAAAGVWKAGAAFVIADENYAPERAAFIREDCGCKAEINQDTWEQILERAPKDGWEDPDPHDAAFAVYTSGSTGTPKGVLHEYGNISRCIASLEMEGNPMLGSGIFRTFTAPQNFVAAIIGLIGVMAADRGRMYVVSYAAAKSPDRLGRLFKKYRFNTVFLSPSYARVLAPRIAPYLRTLVIGSEPAGGLYLDGPRLLNFYASSESLFLISAFRIDRTYEQTPIGNPTFPLDLRLLDENGQEVPAGEAGEIVYDAPYLRGYIHLPEETKAALKDGYFHSGDLARRDEEGRLILIGRKSEMIKINGNRVEPGEIENVVKRLLGIDWAAARGFGEEDGRGMICVYYLADITFDPAELQRKMADYLPYYMIPTHFTHIDKIPLTPNGKLNRRALPMPETENLRGPSVPPENETEAALCRGFEQVLGIPRVGREDDFYSLGGDSLRAIRTVMESGLDDLNVSQIFQGRTPKGIAEIYLRQHEAPEGEPPEVRNRRAMEREHPLITEQIFMMDTQLYTPVSTMYNLHVLLETEKGRLDAERLAKAAEITIRAHPSMLTKIYFNADGDLVQRYCPELFEEIRAERISEAEFDRVKDELVQPYRINGGRMYRCRVFETEERVYFFLDVHHILFDGTSFRVFLDDLSAVYTGGTPRPDYYYLYLEEREKERRTPFFQECREYYKKKYGGRKWSSYPKLDRHSRENGAGETSMPITADPAALAEAERRYRVSRNTFFITCGLLTLSAFNGTKDVKISWIFSGRGDRTMVTSTGLYFRDLPAGLHLEEDMKLTELFAEIQKQVNDGMAYSCYPYNEEGFSSISENCAYVLYQQNLRDAVRIGNVKMRKVRIRQNRAASQTVLDIQVLDGDRGLQLLMDYSAGLYEASTMERFGRMLNETAEKLIAAAAEPNSVVGDIIPGS